VRVVGAKTGANLAQGGAGLQAAAIGSKTAMDKIKSLVNDDARSLLIEAIEDPKKMTVLLNRINAETAPEVIKSINSVLGGQAAIAATERPLPNERTTLDAVKKRQAALRDKQPQASTVYIEGGNPDLAGTYNDQEAIEYIQNVERQGTEQ
jgi:hypothetical protein